MAGNNAFNNKDTMDINELAALNDDISPELIEQLQQKLTQEAQSFSVSTKSFDENDDTTLFEEPQPIQENIPPIELPTPQTEEVNAEIVSPQQEQIENILQEIPLQEAPLIAPATNLSADDAFMKKYKAKLDKQRNAFSSEFTAENSDDEKNKDSEPKQDIGKLSNGSITEKTITQAQKNYNDSLDLLDGNVKYSKYVIYIDPQNVDFIEGLTVKERKNLINRILREQDDISITRRKFRTVQTVIKHVIVSILTVTISIPIIYWAINASLEVSINNYRRSQTNFQTLYKDNGKINIKQH